jgi:hypothetical protein
MAKETLYYEQMDATSRQATHGLAGMTDLGISPDSSEPSLE